MSVLHEAQEFTGQRWTLHSRGRSMHHGYSAAAPTGSCGRTDLESIARTHRHVGARDEPRPQRMSAELARILPDRTDVFLYDVGNDLIRETRGTDMPMLVHATKEGAVPDPRFFQPTQHGAHGAGRFVPAVWNADLPPLMQLIRLALVHRQNQALRGQPQICHVQPDEFTAAHGSGKTEQ